MFIKIVMVLLAFFAAVDCLRRREDAFWFFIIICLPIIGPIIYFAYTRDWTGTFSESEWHRLLYTSGGPSLSRLKERAKTRDTPDAWQEYGSALAAAGKNSAAIEALELILKREGLNTQSEVRFQLAVVYKRIKRLRDALDQLRLILSSEPGFRYGEVQIELADCLQLQNDDQAAEEIYLKVINKYQSAQASYQYGILLKKMGQQEKALEQMQDVIKAGKKSGATEQDQEFAVLAEKFLKKCK